MRNFSIKIVLSLALVFSVISCSPDPVDQGSSFADLSKATMTYDYSGNETELVDLINDYRVSIGLNRLELINYASIKSEEHDFYMIENDDVSHAGFKERADDIIRVLGVKKVNENIAYNYATGQSALNAWLNSTGHRANIEGDFTHFGISIRTNPKTGKKYYTNIFVKR